MQGDSQLESLLLSKREVELEDPLGRIRSFFRAACSDGQIALMWLGSGDCMQDSTRHF